MVLPAPSIPGSRNMRIGSCVKSLLKNCSTMQLLFLLMFWSMAAQNLMLHLRYAKRYGLVSTLDTGFTQYAYP